MWVRGRELSIPIFGVGGEWEPIVEDMGVEMAGLRDR